MITGPGAIAQEIKLTSGFLKDSAMIGDEIPYYLTATYPSKLTILFPDSSYRYTPFDLHHKKYFPTATTDGISYDSVLYYLNTFEIDSLQSLRLPVFIVSAADCTVFYSPADTLPLDPLIASIPDSLDARGLLLKTNVAYESVSQTTNYVVIAAILFIVIAVSVTLWLVFGKKIRRRWLIKRMQKRYNRFVNDYTTGMLRIKSSLTASSAEAVVLIWKKYLEELERAPFTKLTTRETINILKEPSLEQPLRAIDRLIYGNAPATVEPFEQLHSFASKEFHRKLEELKNG
jgi:hypothetical protein